MNLFFWITVLLKIVLFIILFGLFKIYLDSYKKIKISYTVGLLLFSGILLFFNFASLIAVLSNLFIPQNPDFPTFTKSMLIETIVQLIAMGILFKVTRDE